MASISEKVIRKFIAMKRERIQKEGIRKPSYKLNKLENVICEIQRILIWDDPDYSLGCFLLVNTVFSLVTFMEFKFFGLIFFLLFCFSFEDMCIDYIDKFAKREGLDDGSNVVPTTKKPGFLTNADITGYLKKSHSAVKNACDKIKHFRRSDPGMFCVLTCLCFLWLNVVGQSITDVKTFYLLLMPIMIVPGMINHYVPPYIFSSFSDLIYSSRKGDKENDDEVEFYLPENTPENIELLNLAGDVNVTNKEEDEESNDLLLERISARTSDTTAMNIISGYKQFITNNEPLMMFMTAKMNETSGEESVSSKLSFFPESSLMPSPETSMDFLDLDLTSGGHPDREKLESNGSENNDINFQSQHFDGESSDEDEFLKGLTLNENDQKKTTKKEVKSHSDNVGPSMLNPGSLMAMGTTLLNAIKNSRKPSTNDKESSDDTDSFEIISDEDM